MLEALKASSKTPQALGKTADMQRRLRTMGYSAELLDNDFMASPEDLVRPDVQISPVRTIADFEFASLKT